LLAAMHATLNNDSVPGTRFVTRLTVESAPRGRDPGTPSPAHVA
jgi:hypothetical protein